MTDEDFEKLPLPSKHTVELAAFVDAEQIDPHLLRTYYLEPDEKGVKPYALLMRALKEKGLTGLAKIAIRNKEQLCALRPMEDDGKGGGLVLETLFYPDEIREMPSEVPDVDVNKRELDMAYALIDLLQEDFEPEKYKDEYRVALQDDHRRRSRGHRDRDAGDRAAGEGHRSGGGAEGERRGGEEVEGRARRRREEEEEKPRRRKKVAAAS